MRLIATALAVALAGCGPSITTTFDQCAVSVEFDVTEGEPGTQVAVSGGPFSQTHDTNVRFGSVDAQVDDVTRTNCDLCDTCLVVADCTACEVCTACTDQCALCTESMAFTVPAVEPGQYSVVVTNRFGTSDTLPFTVASENVDTADSGGTE